MKLIQGCRYNIRIKLLNDTECTEFYGMYFMGRYECDESEHICCDCCGKAVMKYPYVFRLPVGRVSYEECMVAYYTNELVIGSSCLQKAEITLSSAEQKSCIIYPQNN